MRAVEKLLMTKRLLAHVSRDYAPVAMHQTFCAEDIVLAHLIFSDLVHTEFKNIHMFAIDTGRSSEDVYRSMESLQQRYGNVLTVYHPDSSELATFDAQYGFGDNYFQRSIDVRFNKPLYTALSGRNAWISTRVPGQVSVAKEKPGNSIKPKKAWISWDQDHQLPCFNPMVRWTQEEISHYAKHHGLALFHVETDEQLAASNALSHVEDDKFPAAVGLG